MSDKEADLGPEGPGQDPAKADPWTAAGQEMVAAARMLHGLGLAPGTGGNLSLRVEGALLTTPSGSHKGLLTEDQLIRCSLEGKPLGPGPAHLGDLHASGRLPGPVRDPGGHPRPSAPDHGPDRGRSGA